MIYKNTICKLLIGASLVFATSGCSRASDDAFELDSPCVSRDTQDPTNPCARRPLFGNQRGLA